MFNHAYTETPATACKNQFTQCVSVSGEFSHLAKEMIQCLIQVTLYFQFQADSKSRVAISNLKFLTIIFTINGFASNHSKNCSSTFAPIFINFSFYLDSLQNLPADFIDFHNRYTVYSV